MYPNCLCGGTTYKSYHFNRGGDDFEVIECSQCGLARTWPIPLIDQDKQTFYDQQDDFNERLEQIALWNKFLERTIKIIKKYKNGGDLLEVGCNVGICVDLANKGGYNAYGIDLSKRATDIGKEKFSLGDRLSQGTLNDQKKNNKKYDILVYTHVLEHIEKIFNELADARELLKQDGILFIEVPNFNSIWRKVLGSKWYGFINRQHVWQFSKKPLEKIIKKNGFDVLFSTTKFSLYHQVRFNIKGFIKMILHLLAYVFNSGDNLIIVAKKNN